MSSSLPYAGARRTCVGDRGGSTEVVRGFHRHVDVMRVGLLEPGGGDADELATLLQFVDRVRADVEHRWVQAADELVRNGRQRAAIGDLPLDALGDDLVVG